MIRTSRLAEDQHRQAQHEAPHVVKAEELTPGTQHCPVCHGTMLVLFWDGSHRPAHLGPPQRQPDWDQLGELRALIPGQADRVCRTCRMRREIARLSHRTDAGPRIVSAETLELEALRAQLNPPAPPPKPEPIEGALFDTGNVYWSPAAQDIVRAAVPAHVERAAEREAQFEQSRRDWLRQHATGRWGLNGTSRRVRESDRDKSVLAPLDVQNSVSIVEGRGTVKSVYPIWRSPTYEGHTPGIFGHLHIWTEIGSLLTLCHAGTDGVRMD
jgi:hypothetical protein